MTTIGYRAFQNCTALEEIKLPLSLASCPNGLGAQWSSERGQIFYGFGAYYMPEQAFNYLRGKHSVSGAFTLDITSGVGTTGQDVRFLANAEIVLYRMKQIESQTPQQPQAPQVQQPQDTQEQQVEP